MRVVVFSTKPYDRTFLEAENERHGHALRFVEARLTPETAVLAAGAEVVCAFVNDRLDAEVLAELARLGVRLVALRSAGFNHVDLAAARELGVAIARVPAYSPYAVAEHTVGIILALNRQLHRAFARVREGNFALDGLLGFDLHGRTVGVVGTGKIGAIVARIMAGFGCAILAYDLRPNPDCEALGARYVSVPELLAESDIVTLHCPLTPETHPHDRRAALAGVRRGMMLINTSRGALVDTPAVIDALKSGAIGPPRARRLRGRGRPVLREPVGPRPAGRRVRAAADVPERPDHGPPGVLHARGAGQHRSDDAGEH
jgi:D-lactate dehydrogenase